MRTSVVAWLATITMISAASLLHAAEPVTTRIADTQRTSPTSGATDAARQLAEATVEGRMWGLTGEEMVRARELTRFRQAFTSITLSPVEVLGVHARTDAERKRYAELFARILHDDTIRVLAFQQAHSRAARRLYPNEQVLDLPKGSVPRNFFGAAE